MKDRKSREDGPGRRLRPPPFLAQEVPARLEDAVLAGPGGLGGGGGLRLGGTWTTMIVAQVAMAVAGLPIAFGGFWGTITEAATTKTFETRPYLAATIASFIACSWNSGTR